MDNVQILLIAVNILVGLVTFLTSGISLLVWNRITTETKDRKAATDALWDKYNDESKTIQKNERNIVMISTSLDIDIEKKVSQIPPPPPPVPPTS